MSLPPPYSLKCREIRLDCSGICGKWAQFRNYCSQTGLEKVYCSRPHAGFAAFFSGGHPRSPVSKTPSGECNAIVVNCVDAVVIETVRDRFSGDLHFSLGQIVYGISSQSSREEMIVLICGVNIRKIDLPVEERCDLVLDLV